MLKNIIKLFCLLSAMSSNVSIIAGKDSKPMTNDVLYDSVVRVESSTFKFSFLKPYRKLPSSACSGSGFFISPDEIATNYHVVNNSFNVTVEHKALGKNKLQANVVGVCPSLDVALLKLTDESKKLLSEKRPNIKLLPFGDSDKLNHGDEITTLGFPLGVDKAKQTKGVISGTEPVAIPDQNAEIPSIQIDAAINGGNSGGPTINKAGEIIGINFYGYCPWAAQNTNYVIPISYISGIFDQLRKQKFVRKIPHSVTKAQVVTPCLASWLKKESPGGIFVPTLSETSLAYEHGVREGDVIASINGFDVDSSGEVDAGWCGDATNTGLATDRFLRQGGLELKLFRNGETVKISIPTPTPEEIELHTPKIRFKFPMLEAIPCQIFGGIVFTDLCLNHLFNQNETPWSQDKEVLTNSGLKKYLKPENQHETKIVVSEIMQSSVAITSRAQIEPGVLISSVNDHPVKELCDVTNQIEQSLKDGEKFVVIGLESGLKIPMPLKEVVDDELRLSQLNGYKAEHSAVLAHIEAK